MIALFKLDRLRRFKKCAKDDPSHLNTPTPVLFHCRTMIHINKTCSIPLVQMAREDRTSFETIQLFNLPREKRSPDD